MRKIVVVIWALSSLLPFLSSWSIVLRSASVSESWITLRNVKISCLFKTRKMHMRLEKRAHIEKRSHKFIHCSVKFLKLAPKWSWKLISWFRSKKIIVEVGDRTRSVIIVIYRNSLLFFVCIVSIMCCFLAKKIVLVLRIGLAWPRATIGSKISFSFVSRLSLRFSLILRLTGAMLVTSFVPPLPTHGYVCNNL